MEDSIYSFTAQIVPFLMLVTIFTCAIFIGILFFTDINGSSDRYFETRDIGDVHSSSVSMTSAGRADYVGYNVSVPENTTKIIVFSQDYGTRITETEVGIDESFDNFNFKGQIHDVSEDGPGTIAKNTTFRIAIVSVSGKINTIGSINVLYKPRSSSFLQPAFIISLIVSGVLSIITIRVANKRNISPIKVIE